MNDYYDYMNRTELLQLLASDKHGNHRLRTTVPAERLIHLLRTGEQPQPEELAQTTETRKKLQVWIEKNWLQIGSQLPCSGPNKGKCTIYPCSEGKHLDCYLHAQKHML
jgi:hypothetical protein